MRRQLLLLVAATTSIVLLAFLVPLATLVRNLADKGAVSGAVQVAASLAGSVTDLTGIRAAVADARRRTPEDEITVYGSYKGRRIVLGDSVAPDRYVRQVIAETTQLEVSQAGGKTILQPAVVVSGDDAGTWVVRVFVPGSRLRTGVLRAWVVLAALGVALFLLALGIAYRSARSLLRPINALAHIAERLEKGDLSARVAVSGTSEVREVGTALNRLAERIGDLLAAERESVADLSHRLRTPVTALRLDADGLSDPEERARMGADVDELARQVDTIIREARRPVREGVGAHSDATVVVAERTAFWSALAEDQDRAVQVLISPGPIDVRVGPEDLGAVVDALLGNVFAHTPEGTPFGVQLASRRGGGAILSVWDSGAGLPAGAARRGSSSAGSTGLGLDIVRRTAEASGGRLRLGRGGTGGAEVTVELGPPPR